MPITDIEVCLSEKDGNAGIIIGAVSRALRRGGHANLVTGFVAEATAGDYDHVLQTCMKYVEVI